MAQKIEVVDAEPFVVVPLETTDVSTPLPEILQPISESMEETQDAAQQKPKRRPAKSRAKPPLSGAPPADVEHALEQRGSAPVGAPTSAAPAPNPQVLAPQIQVLTDKALEAKEATPVEPISRRGRPQGARNKPRPAIIERVVERVEAPALSVDDIRKLLQESIRKQGLEARSQKRAHYAQLLRVNRHQ